MMWAAYVYVILFALCPWKRKMTVNILKVKLFILTIIFILYFFVHIFAHQILISFF